jgi:hypothetical protein
LLTSGSLLCFSFRDFGFRDKVKSFFNVFIFFFFGEVDEAIGSDVVAVSFVSVKERELVEDDASIGIEQVEDVGRSSGETNVDGPPPIEA